MKLYLQLILLLSSGISSLSEPVSAPDLALPVTAKIVSCAGCSLRRFPDLYEFLTDGEAEFYQGVEVEYVQGLASTMTLYDSSGQETEKVDLTTVATSKEGFHEYMISKGFVKKPDEVVEQNRQLVWQRKEDERRKDEEMRNRILEKQKRMQGKVTVKSVTISRGSEAKTNSDGVQIVALNEDGKVNASAAQFDVQPANIHVEYASIGIASSTSKIETQSSTVTVEASNNLRDEL